MLTTATTPISAAIAAFVTAAVNLIVILGVWSATPNQIAAVNVAVLAGLALVSTVRAQAQRTGTLVATPKPPTPEAP